MTKTPVGIKRARLVRRGLSLSLLAALALCALAPAAWVAAQSGRRKTDPARQSPAPQPTVPSAGAGESESQPSPKAKNQTVAATFVVVEDENLFLDISATYQRDIIGASFFERLKQSPVVAVERGGKASRKEARERAKKEREAYVVLLQLEEDMMATRTGGTNASGRVDPSYFAIRIYVYAPGSGDVKFTDTVSQRPYRPTARVGGVRIPVPVSGPERYPGENQLAQTARDAADRLLARFDIQRPPEN